jgi:hypothetical protein
MQALEALDKAAASHCQRLRPLGLAPQFTTSDLLRDTGGVESGQFVLTPGESKALQQALLSKVVALGNRNRGQTGEVLPAATPFPALYK